MNEWEMLQWCCDGGDDGERKKADEELRRCVVCDESDLIVQI